MRFCDFKVRRFGFHLGGWPNEWAIPFSMSVYGDHGHFQFLCIFFSWSKRSQ
jgi:hypothetical protein